MFTQAWKYIVTLWHFSQYKCKRPHHATGNKISNIYIENKYHHLTLQKHAITFEQGCTCLHIYIQIYFYMEDKYENMSPCTSLKVNTNYKRILSYASRTSDTGNTSFRLDYPYYHCTLFYIGIVLIISIIIVVETRYGKSWLDIFAECSFLMLLSCMECQFRNHIDPLWSAIIRFKMELHNSHHGAPF